MNEIIVTDNTLASQVINQLRKEIITKRIEPGSRITIKEISERYGVSNMPVREAFRTLEGEKLLAINAHKGATVLRVDESFARDMYGLLRALEDLIYETALPQVDEEMLESLRAINEKIKKLAPTEESRRLYLVFNSEFHDVIMSRGKNGKARELYNYYHMLVNTLRSSYVHKIERIAAAANEHDELIAALESKDTHRLKDAVDRHVINSMESFLGQYSQE